MNDLSLISNFRSYSEKLLSSFVDPAQPGFLVFDPSGKFLHRYSSKPSAMGYSVGHYLLCEKTGFVFLLVGSLDSFLNDRWEVLTASYYQRRDQ